MGGFVGGVVGGVVVVGSVKEVVKKVMKEEEGVSKMAPGLIIISCVLSF